MSKFSVTASELNSAISTLNEDNNQFRARVNDLMTCANELATMWQGEANDKFNTALMNDREKWDEFASLIDQYVEALQFIVQTYSTAEENNTSTATTRIY